MRDIKLPEVHSSEPLFLRFKCPKCDTEKEVSNLGTKKYLKCPKCKARMIEI